MRVCVSVCVCMFTGIRRLLKFRNISELSSKYSFDKRFHEVHKSYRV